MKKFFTDNSYWMLTGLVGAGFFLLVFGWRIVDFTNTDWILSGLKGIDSVQHQAGWVFFRNSPWQWPIGIASAMGSPNGVSVSYTDSIPLLAIPFKVFSALLPETFQYLGFFNLLSYIIQGAAAALLIHVFTTNKATIFAGSLLFLLAPCMLNRTMTHDALTAQWLIVFSLYLYCRFCKDHSFAYHWRFAVLNLLAICIHPYLFVMTLAIYGVLICVDLITAKCKSAKIRTIVASLVMQAILVGASGYAIGLFSGEKVNPAKGFGAYSANLNAFFNPLTYQSFSNWSSLLATRSQFVTQLEGFSYLGLGVLLGLLVLVLIFLCSLITKRSHLQKFWGEVKELHWEMLGLVFLFCVFFAFAVSNVITFDDHELLKIPLPEMVFHYLTIFRSSGRFIWLPVFCILLLICLGFDRFFAKKAYILLLIFCLVQLIDIKPALEWHHQYAAASPIPANASENWSMLDQNYQKVFVSGIYQDYFLAYWLADHQKTTNLNFSAPIHFMTHSDDIHKTFDEVRNLLLSDDALPRDTAYLFQDEALANELAAKPDRSDWLTEGVLYGGHYYMLLPALSE